MEPEPALLQSSRKGCVPIIIPSTPTPLELPASVSVGSIWVSGPGLGSGPLLKDIRAPLSITPQPNSRLATAQSQNTKENQRKNRHVFSFLALYVWQNCCFPIVFLGVAFPFPSRP